MGGRGAQQVFVKNQNPGTSIQHCASETLENSLDKSQSFGDRGHFDLN